MADSVSVVITCYNLERYIGDAISSVRKQDYAGQIQIIVVDDRSTDRSRDILRNAAGIDTVMRNENGGVMRAMISGIREAQHDMVFFLDGDDIWHREKLTRCMAHVTPHTKLSTHDLWYIDSNGQTIVKENRVTEVLGQTEPTRRSASIEKCLLEHDDYVWLGSAFGVSRSRGAVDAFIVFCEKRNYLDTCYQDWPLAVWVALETGGEIAFAKQKLFGYRLHAENYSGASQTLRKLRRNLTKSRDTIRLIEEIIGEKRGSAAVAQTYRQVRMRYDLRLASTLPGRRRLVGHLLRAALKIPTDRESIKVILRVILVLLFGPERAHELVERLKS
jgi:glycosyltransferase involved in cell wall biosynthesis